MTAKRLLILTLLAVSFGSFAQNAWTTCQTASVSDRIDDLFMVNPQTGYAACGDGQIIKTTDGGDNWYTLYQDDHIYRRSIEFTSEKTGFSGGFPNATDGTHNILLKTIDGGTTWTDLTLSLHPRARRGICGLAAPDTNTIYGCGNWYDDSTGYIVKSTDGGTTWDYIDMSAYASSIIDMHFISKDTGFATGRSPLPLQTAVILYTTDGGTSWTYKFQNTTSNEYCWKIQHLTDQVYFASIEDINSNTLPKVLKSTDGGMTWQIHYLSSNFYNIEGVGFIDSLNGWAGGGTVFSFATTDGGTSWTKVEGLCPAMNRVFKVNDSLLFVSGYGIWRYGPPNASAGIKSIANNSVYTSIACYPNPVNDNLAITASLSRSTHVLIVVFDEQGKQVELVDNTDKPKGDFQYKLNTRGFRAGTYYVVLKTHEDKQVQKIIVSH